MEQSDDEDDRKLPASDNNKNIRSNSIIAKKEKVTSVKKNPAKKNKNKSTQPEGMPERPLSAYNYFFRDERARLLKAREEGKAGEIGSARAAQLFSAMGKTIAKRWKELPDEERAVYTKTASEDSKRYRREKAEYQQKLAKIDKEATEKQHQSRPSALVAVQLNVETASGNQSLSAGHFDQSQFSAAATTPSYNRSNLSRLQMQNDSAFSRLEAAAGEQTSNLAGLQAVIIAREQRRIDEMLRAQQIQSLIGRNNVSLGGLGQSNQLHNISNVTSQDLYLASLSNSLGQSTFGRSPIGQSFVGQSSLDQSSLGQPSRGSDFGTGLNAPRTIQEAALQQELLNEYRAQQSYNSQLALAAEQQVRQQQLLQRALLQPAAASTNRNLNAPLISELLLRQNQSSNDLTTREENDESSGDGRFP